MIDFHCHLDLYPNPVAVLEQAVARQMYLLVVTTTPKAWKETSRLVGNSKRVRVSPGLHPELVGERFSEAPFLSHLIARSRYVGEIGLDGSTHLKASYDKQEAVFRRALQDCAVSGQRVMSIHSRAAATGVLDLLADCPNAGIPVLHWFSGSQRELERAVSLGCWFSVGPAMLKSAKGRKLAEGMPKDRILTETDGPFARLGNVPLMPWDVDKAERDLAAIWDVPTDVAERQMHQNLKHLASLAEGYKVAADDSRQ